MADYYQYDLSEDDPYLIPNSTCLINSLGFTNMGDLNKAEAEITKITQAQLIANPIQGDFDLEHLLSIHKFLFQDIYPWAGEVRTTEIAKAGLFFLPHNLIQEETKRLFGNLHQESKYQGLDLEAFIEKAAHFFGYLNMIHPFREGNGRTQRVLLDQLAERAGYVIEWASVSDDAMAKACREARTKKPDYSKLTRLLLTSTLTIEQASNKKK